MSSKVLLPSVFVITGGTRGVGFGLARELLRRAQNVFICGRSQDAVTDAVSRLREHANSGNDAGGCRCDISVLSDVEQLWDSAVAQFGRVDVFVNNAGVSPHKKLTDISPELLATTLDCNIKGALFCVRVALIRQSGEQGSTGRPARPFRIYLMEGLGSDGSVRSATATSNIYSLTKYAGAYLAKFVESELKNDPALKGSNISVGRLSPGMVTTDLLLGSFPSDPGERAKVMRIMNILADKEETVTPWLAERLVAGDLTIRWLTALSVLGRFIKSLFVKRDLFSPEQ